MKCPICSERLPSHPDRCPCCGYRLPVSPPVLPDEPSRPRRNTRRGCAPALVRVLLLSTLLPLLLSFVRMMWVEEGAVQVAPESAVASHPAAEGCFTITGGAVTFLPDRWDGGPVLTIPDRVSGQTVTSLAPGCFRGCNELTTVILPESLTSISDEAFSGCSKLRGLYLPEGMESIGENAFAGCSAMEAICIPATVTAIAPGSFDDCASLLYINYGSTFGC